MAARYQRQAAPELLRAPQGIGGNIAEALDRFGDRYSQAVDPIIAARDTNRIQGEIASGGDVEPSIGLTPIQLQRNAVAQRAYIDRAQLSIASHVTGLHQEFDGNVPAGSDAKKYLDTFTQRIDAHAGPQLDGIPEAYRGEALQQFQRLRARAVSDLSERTFAIEDEKNVANMKAADALDVEVLNRAMRDGDSETATEAGLRLAARRQDMIDAGLMPPTVAEAEAMEIASAAQAEAIFGRALRGGDLPGMVQELMAGEGLAQGLTLRDRDTAVAKITHEMNRRHGEMARAEAESDMASKDVRDTITTSLWANLYSGDAAKRPTSEQIVAAASANLISDDEAQQMIRTLATDKAARNDITVISTLESEITQGMDAAKHIADAQAAGTIDPSTAADLYDKNTKMRQRDFPPAIRDLRQQLDRVVTKTSDMADFYPAEEASRKVFAFQFFDEQTRAAPPGVNPETGISFQEEAARRALLIVEQRQREQDVSTMLRLPPRSAVYVEPTQPGEPLRLDIRKTVKKLQADEMVGLIGPDQSKAELRLIKQWEDAGLVVVK